MVSHMAFWNRWKRKKKQHVQDEQESDSLFSREKEQEDNAPLQDDSVVNKPQEPAEQPVSSLEQEEMIPADLAGQKRYVLDCCEAVAESERQIAIVKTEYEQVTEYLTDIQKIDRIEGESREMMLSLCKKITYLLKERNLFKNREITISEAQIRRFDIYQETLIDEIKKMYQNEMYQKAIESDMGHLEKEKVHLRQEQKEIVEKQNALKGMAKILSALIVSLFVLFWALYYTMKIDVTYPYLGTLLLAAVFATAIFQEANKNRRDMTLSERKMSKAIGLLNRTKIKYINNVSVLDYDRQKYGVKSAKDFEGLWGEYCKAKEYERKFKENTEQLHQSNENLLHLLEEYQVADPEVWLIQTYAILDNREMVEIRHELNQRRQKLREQVAYNNAMKTEMTGRIQRVLEKNPQNARQLQEVVIGFERRKPA